jgi:hypothetical protein
MRALGGRVVRASTAIPVRAWLVTSQGRDVEVDAEAVAWTDRAVNVRYFDEHGREGFTWVWASAVVRRS